MGAMGLDGLLDQGADLELPDVVLELSRLDLVDIEDVGD